MKNEQGSNLLIDMNAIPKLNLEELEAEIRDLFSNGRVIMEKEVDEVMGYYRRPVKLYTGAGGADMFDEALENQMGMRRVYIGKKVPRFLRVLKFKVLRSRRGRYYKLVKSKDYVQLSSEYRTVIQSNHPVCRKRSGKRNHRSFRKKV